MSSELSGLLGGAISAGANVAASNKAWRRQKKVLQNQIRWKVADLRAAGLNPILAAGSGLQGGAPSVAMPHIPNMAEAMQSGASAGKQTQEKKTGKERETTERMTQQMLMATRYKAYKEGETETFKQQLMREQTALTALDVTRARPMANFYQENPGLGVTADMIQKLPFGEAISGLLRRRVRAR